MSFPTVLSLCDLTGNMVEPWLKAGYTAILVDPQHGESRWENTEGGGPVLKLAMTVDAYLTSGLLEAHKHWLTAVFAFPPCTEFATSGARWFKRKYEKDPLFQVKAMVVAEQCRTIGRMSGVPYMIENPSGILSTAWEKPQHTFNPFDYTAFEPEDNYRKRTCLWTGNGFKMPPPEQNPELGEPDQRILMAGESLGRQNFRSATPLGFARAVFKANHKETNNNG